MSYLLLFELVVLGILYLVSVKRGIPEIVMMKSLSGRSSCVLPLGMLVSKIVEGSFYHRYNRKIERRIKELYGEKNAAMFLEIHNARKHLIILGAIVFMTFVGTQIDLDEAFVFFFVSLPAVLFYVTDRKLDEKIKERKRSMQIEFPEFLNKLTLLINAGLTVHGAIYKVVKDNRKSNPLYMELELAENEIDSGKSEIQVYEDFAKRCRLPEITMFVSALIQNLRKGNDELVPILRLQASICWENRKNIARKLGEEASTKLLFPMMIIFVAILAMIMTPAVIQLKF